MWTLFGNKKKRTVRSKRGFIIYFALITAGIFLIAAASLELIVGEREYISAREEYDQLTELYPVMSSYLSGLWRSLTDDPELSGSDLFSFGRESTFSDSGSGDPSADGDEHPDPLAGLLGLNPDFVGWISIDEIINYPVVRGSDNSRYLNTTFTGQNNPSGTVFMDSRNEQGFDSHVCILYGHNMKDRSMFAQLHNYRNQSFMEEHPLIIIITAEGEILTYQVFAARLVTDENRAYRLNFPDVAAAARFFPKSPEGASRFLLLSTCTTSSYNFERLLVYATLVE